MEIDYMAMFIGLLGGLALFLYGIDQMTEALKSLAGQGLKKVLSKLTKNRFMGALTGSIFTALTQSSSVTTVLVVGFVSVGLMNLEQAVGVIMGANIGTTFTAQLIAFKLTKYALALFFVGFLPLYFVKNEKARQFFQALLGLGLVFLGMNIMSDATYVLRSCDTFTQWMRHLESPLAGVAVGLVFTAMVQSSAAITGLVIVFASQGYISLEAGIALVFGANIGTCIAAVLACIGKSRLAVQAMMVHVLFNVLGVLLWFPFIPQLARWVRVFSPKAEHLSDIARLAAETPRQIANAHTFFNVANTAIFIFVTPLFALVVRKLIPEKMDKKLAPAQEAKKRLDPVLLQSPALALEQVRREILSLGHHLGIFLHSACGAALKADRHHIDQLEKQDDVVDRLQEVVVAFLGKMSRESLSVEESELVLDYLKLCNYMENIGDVLSADLLHQARDRVSKGVSISDDTQKNLQALIDKVSGLYDDFIKALESEDPAGLDRVLAEKESFNELNEQITQRLAIRLSASASERVQAYRLETDMAETLRRVNDLIRRAVHAGHHSLRFSDRDKKI